MSRPSSPRWRFRRLSLQVLDDRRVLAAITGAVFADLDQSSTRGVDESGLAGRLVYLDQNDNAAIDQGEPFALTDQAGEFSIEDLEAGDHVVRLFNGTSSQVQTSPLSADWVGSVRPRSGIGATTPAFVSPPGGSDEVLPAVYVEGTFLRTVSSDEDESVFSIDLGHSVTAVGRLDDARLWALGGEAGEPRGWIIDADLSAATSIDLSGFGTGSPDLQIETVAVDDQGRGVLMTHTGDPAEQASLWKLDVTASAPVGSTATQLPADSILVADPSPRPADGPTRAIVAIPQATDGQPAGLSDSLAIHVWHHDDSGPLSQPAVIEGATDVVAFSDTAGLLVLRHESHLTVHDVDNALATLYQLPNTATSLALDAEHGWLLQPSSDQSSIRWLEAETGALLAETAIDLTLLGDDVVLKPDAALQAVLAIGSAGIAEIGIRRDGARKLTLAEDETDSSVLFGLQVSGENVAPRWSGPTTWDAIEDTALEISAALWAEQIVDEDQGQRADSPVTLVISPPSQGTIALDPSGAVTYTPAADAFGTDSMDVLLHDGRDFSEATIFFEVAPLADPPTGLLGHIEPFPEDVSPGYLLGPIFIQDVDYPGGSVAAGIDHDVQVQDPRFEVQSGQLVYVGGTIDFESEPEIYLTTSVQSDDGVGGGLPAHLFLQVTDADDPTEAILPEQATVRENDEGAFVGWLTVIDEDTNQSHTLTVDDPRFEIDQGVLRLVAGTSLDREAESTVRVNVTANEGTEGELTREIAIHVLDVPESPQQMMLQGDTVRELEVGAVVGTVLVDGNPAGNGHTVTVDNADFVVEDSVLKLSDGRWVTQQEQSFIVLNVTASIESDAVSPGSITQEYTIEVLANPTPYHNDEMPYDVSGDGEISAVDALMVINHLNEHGPGIVGPGDPLFGVDVNADGTVTALDALLIINELNRLEATVGAVKGEGESAADQAQQPPEPSGLSSTPRSDGSRAEELPDADPSVSASPASSTDLPVPDQMVAGTDRSGVQESAPAVTPPADRSMPLKHGAPTLRDDDVGVDSPASHSQRPPSVAGSPVERPNQPTPPDLSQTASVRRSLDHYFAESGRHDDEGMDLLEDR